MRITQLLSLGVLVVLALASCSETDSPSSSPSTSPVPHLETSSSGQAAEDRDAQLQNAIAGTPFAGTVFSRAWNGDTIQVGVSSDRSTSRDRIRLCTDLGTEFGDSYGIKQILITTVPVSGDDSGTATDEQLPPVVRWNYRDRACAEDPAGS